MVRRQCIRDGVLRDTQMYNLCFHDLWPEACLIKLVLLSSNRKNKLQKVMKAKKYLTKETKL